MQENYKEKYEKLQKQFEKLKAEIKSNQTKLNEQEKIHDEQFNLKNILIDSQQQEQQFQIENKIVTDKINKITSENDKLLEKKDSQENEIRELQSLIKAKNDKQYQHNEKIKRVALAIEQLNQEIAKLKLQLEEKEQEILELKFQKIQIYYSHQDNEMKAYRHDCQNPSNFVSLGNDGFIYCLAGCKKFSLNYSAFFYLNNKVAQRWQSYHKNFEIIQYKSDAMKVIDESLSWVWKYDEIKRQEFLQLITESKEYNQLGC